MYNRADILRQAWVDYRFDVEHDVIDGTKFNRAHFAECLKAVWAQAKFLAAREIRHAAQRVAKVEAALVHDLPIAARIAEIDAELEYQDFVDFIDWDRRTALQVELAGLRNSIIG